MTDQEESGSRANSTIARDFTALSFVWRFLFSLVLVLATYNPTGLSYYEWVGEALGSSQFGAVHFFVGVILLVGWIILWVATWRALELLGVVLAAVAIGALVWLLIDLGLLDTEGPTAIRWIALVSLALLLSIGLSWSHIWRRLTGQLEVDED
jgi:hypothetical protein